MDVVVDLGGAELARVKSNGVKEAFVVRLLEDTREGEVGGIGGEGSGFGGVIVS
jgi:hypothetical protein